MGVFAGTTNHYRPAYLICKSATDCSMQPRQNKTSVVTRVARRFNVSVAVHISRKAICVKIGKKSLHFCSFISETLR